MFDQLIELYTKGDIKQLSNKLLHSSAWKQHDFTAYGNMQTEKLWLSSLEQFGFLTLMKKLTVHGSTYSSIYFELSNQEENKVSVSCFFEHNNTHIKRLHCVVDTLALSKLLNKTPQQVMSLLPTPDPLQLSQFDHQLHPQSYHAMPSDVADLPKEINDTVSQWWSIWQEKQLINIDKVYSSQAKIDIAGMETSQAPSTLRNFQLKLHNRMNRSYCQLEHICFDEAQNTVAVQWHIDGDYLDAGTIKRIRIPVLSLLTLDNNAIVEEQLQVDWLAVCKSFNLSYPFV